MLTIRNVVLTIAASLLLRLSVDLEPAWWAAWLAPLPLLWLAYSNTRRHAQLWVALAVLSATAVCIPYYRLVMPLPAALAAWLGQSLLWWFAVTATRRIVLSHPRSAWTALAYPSLWVGIDTLMAALLPDGNWASLAYSQAEVLALLQTVSLVGVPGLLFLLCLPASVAALLCWRWRELQDRAAVLALTVALLLAALGYGHGRLQQPASASTMRVGLASIDDAIGSSAAPADSGPIRDGYDALIAQLATSGARLVVLPEKIAVLKPDVATEWQAHFGEIAARHGIWLEVGIGIDDGRAPRNYAWLYDPAGRRVENFEKHYLAPPERAAGYAAGDAWSVHSIEGAAVGLSVCKDMHFAAFGRAYGKLDAQVMLVPAWDFAYVDGWMGSRMTLVRGVENGYAVVRVAREGLLTVSDAYGRVLAQTRSAALPGSSLLAELPVQARLDTLYTRIGDVLGWLSAVVAAAWFAASSRRPVVGPGEAAHLDHS